MFWLIIIGAVCVGLLLIYFSVPGEIRGNFTSGLDNSQMTGDKKSCIVMKLNDETNTNLEIGMSWLESNYSEEGRTYVVSEPIDMKSLEGKKVPLVIYCHGRGGQAWDAADGESTWRVKGNHDGFLCAFPNDPTDFWESPINMEQDLEYLLDMLDDINFRYGGKEGEVTAMHKAKVAGKPFKSSSAGAIDLSRIYFVGFDTGGAFSNKVALIYGGSVFAGVCNFMGGKDATKDTVLENIDNGLKCPILILTGSRDIEKKNCQSAADWFRDHKYEVEYEELEGQSHDYVQSAESQIYDFFKLHHL